MSRLRGAVTHRLSTALALMLVVEIGVIAQAGAEKAAQVPDQYQASASASGLSVVQFKQPNPLPVGPGAFLMFQMPEVSGTLTTSSSVSRASLLYPGPAIAGLSALLCTAGVEPLCGAGAPPVLVEAEYPQTPEATLVTDALTLADPSLPLQSGVGTGTARAQQQSNDANAAFGSVRVDAPDPARQAVLDALAATVDQLPGERRAAETALVRAGGTVTTQHITPLGSGVLQAEATTVVSDIALLAGVVTIESVEVSAVVVSDGGVLQEARSTTRISGVLAAGFPASIGPDGISINGSGDDGAVREQLNGVAGAVADAIAVAVDKLDIEIRDGASSQQPDGTAAAADGLLISLSNSELTDTSPPQVPALCGVTSAIQDPLGAAGLALPPLCAVPDATGTKDRYEIQLGRASVALTASMFASFPSLDDIPVVGPVDSPATLTSSVAPRPGRSPALDGRSPASASPSPVALVSPVPVNQLDRHSQTYLELEASWIGADSPRRVADLAQMLVVVATALGLAINVVFQLIQNPRGGVG